MKNQRTTITAAALEVATTFLKRRKMLVLVRALYI